MIKKLFLGVLLAGSLSLQAQEAPANWFNLDYEADGIHGVSTERAYKELLKGKKSVPVIVSVIDSGVDNVHEDLADVMWVNRGEVPGNGIDDDGNGYIDDINGWNYIGGKNGENVDADTYEVTRLYRKYKYKYENADPSKLTKKAKEEYDFYLKVKEEVQEKLEKAKKNLVRYQTMQDNMLKGLSAVGNLLGDGTLTVANLDSVAALGDEDVVAGVNLAKRIMTEKKTIPGMKSLVKDQLSGAVKHFKTQAEVAFNTDFDSRKVIGDDYSNSYEKDYGNSDVKGPDSFHGTHVAGIIGAIRDNGLGMNGVADNVQIMSVRTVPNGDEHDKDVANAIIYSVDNGATVINMSFGKGYSWDKEAVEKAIKHAEKNDVLLVHAAGNSNQNNDTSDNFPNDMYTKKGLFCKKEKVFNNWLEVGALNYKDGENAVAPFSNYGVKQVDIFAPGMAIYSTTPENNYGDAQGTSMAAPVVAGVAALIRSYYPSLTAVQVKDILMRSSVKRNIKVKKPGSDELVDFKSLSVSGGQVNAYHAIKLAATVKGKKKLRS